MGQSVNTAWARRRGGVIALVIGIAVTGCSADSEDDPVADPSSESPSSAIPEGVDLTAEGTTLDFGESAALSWTPTTSVTGVVEMSVESVTEQRASAFRGWMRDDSVRTARPYFVEVKVANSGESDLGGQQVPVFVRDDQGRLASPWTLGGDYPACQSGPLPEPFEPGDEADLCLVYLVPDGGTAVDLAFAPSPDFDPITWQGDIAPPLKEGGQANKGKRKKS